MTYDGTLSRLAARAERNDLSWVNAFQPSFTVLAGRCHEGSRFQIGLDPLAGAGVNATLTLILQEMRDTMSGIGRMFAMPKMRKYAHRIILGDDEALIAKFPEQKDKVTVLKLDGGKVNSIIYWTPGAEALNDVLK